MSPSVAEQIPKMGRRAIFKKKGGPIEIEDYEVTQPKDLKPGEALVKVEYSGVCHTDLHAMLGDWPLDNKLPLCGGHEGAGRILAIGAGSPPTPFKVGDAVGIKWLADACLTCAYCRQGQESLCSDVKLSGFTHDGSFQTHAVSWLRGLTPIPDMPLDDAAPILCAGVTVYKAIKASGIRVGQWIALPGAGGGLGHLAVQYASVLGLRVIAIDTGDEKRELCMKLGAEKFVDFKKEKDIVSAIKNATDDKLGAHAAVVTAAAAAGYEQALEYIRPGGTVIAVGLPGDGAKISSEIFFHVLYEKTLRGSYVGNRQDAIEALALAANPNGRVKCHYVTRPLEALPEIYEAMHKGTMTGRTVLKLF